MTTKPTLNEIHEALRAYKNNDGIEEFVEDLTWNKKTADLGSLGVATHADSKVGIEGEGEHIWLVFELGGSFYRLTGYYNSYDGSNWDEYGDLEEVKPVQKTITVYEKI